MASVHRVEPRRGQSPVAASDAALRRLEILGRQLAADRPGVPVHPPPSSIDQPPDVAAPSGRHRTPTLSRHERLAGDLHDRLSPRWQSLLGRGLSLHHVVVGVAVVAAFACLSAWWVVSSRPSGVTPVSAPVVPRSVATADVPAPASPAPSAEASPKQDVVVDVTGKVRRPGIVTLPPGSRVADAVDAAGGSRTGADLSTVNLARVLVDGEQVVVGLPAVPGNGAAATSPGAPTAPASPASTAPVNLNTATMEQLDALPGVGPVTATSILQWRTAHGRFTTVDELLEVKGIGDATLADLRDLVVV